VEGRPGEPRARRGNRTSAQIGAPWATLVARRDRGQVIDLRYLRVRPAHLSIGVATGRPDRRSRAAGVTSTYFTPSVKIALADCFGFPVPLTVTSIGYLPAASFLVEGVPSIAPVFVSFMPLGSLTTFFHL